MQQRAHAKAAELGISFAEYMRRLVASDLGPSSQSRRYLDRLQPGRRRAADQRRARQGQDDRGSRMEGAPAKDRQSGRQARLRVQAATIERLRQFSVWFAAAAARDHDNALARAILQSAHDPGHHGPCPSRDVASPEQSLSARSRGALLGTGSPRRRPHRDRDRRRPGGRLGDRRRFPGSGFLDRRPHQLRRDGAAGHCTSRELRC